MKVKSWIAVLFLLSLAVVSVSSAPRRGDETFLASADTADVMKGLSSVRVLVEGIGKVAEEDGLSRDDIQADVELKLRNAGIKVLSKEEWLNTPGSPCLRVYVQIEKLSHPSQFEYSIRVALKEDAILDRTIGQHSAQNRIKVLGVVTWEQCTIGTVGTIRLNTVRNNVKDLVDKFSADYVTANPDKWPEAEPKR